MTPARDLANVNTCTIIDLGKLNYVVNYIIISMRCDHFFLGCPAPYTPVPMIMLILLLMCMCVNFSVAKKITIDKESDVRRAHLHC